MAGPGFTSWTEHEEVVIIEIKVDSSVNQSIVIEQRIE